MEHDLAIADLRVGDEFEGFYILAEGSVKRASNGKSYLDAVLSDATGTVSAKFWDFNGSFSEEDKGSIIKVRALVEEFKGAPQVRIGRMRSVQAGDSYRLSDLVPTAPIDIDAMLQEIRDLVASLEDEDYRRICQAMLERHGESFRALPAAKSFHHSFVSGLLMHTGNMVKLADYLAYQYSEVIDRSLLIAGTLLHDFAKDREFVISKLGLVTDYSVKGSLIGHLVMGAQEIAELAKELGVSEEKSMLLQHLILSHHGDPEFGAAVVPQCAEAELLSFIDRIDSRMEIYAETFQTVQPGSFSPRIFALEKRIYNHGVGEK